MSVGQGQVTAQLFPLHSTPQGHCERLGQSYWCKDNGIFLQFTRKKLHSGLVCSEKENSPPHGVKAEQGGDPAVPEQSRLVLPNPHCDNIQRENSMLPSSPQFLPAPPAWGLQTEKTTSSPVMDGQNLDEYQMISTRRLMGR